jgi:hypothetical protein
MVEECTAQRVKLLSMAHAMLIDRYTCELVKSPVLFFCFRRWLVLHLLACLLEAAVQLIC